MFEKKAQKWINKKKRKEISSINKVNSRLTGPLEIENLEKLKSISLKNIKLTSLKISNCSQLTELDLSELSKLTSLSVSDCPGITKLDFSQSKLNELTKLEVSNLIELDCSNTSVKKLSLKLCPNITKLNCSNNNKLIYLDISNCSKLEFLNCTNSGLTRLDLNNCPKIKDEDLPSNLKIIRERNLVIVSNRNGSGKSTLANVLTNTNEFEESASSVSNSKTTSYKKNFELNGMNYCVIETEKDEVANFMPGKVLFVVDGIFTKEMGTFINGIADDTTIVRTRFFNFRNRVECEKDEKQIREKNKEIKSCSIVYVDNPPANIIVNDEYDKNANITNGIRRNQSRKVLLGHLKEMEW